LIKVATCALCGQSFQYDYTTGTGRVYCSAACSGKAAYARRLKRANVERRCPQCGVVKPGTDFSSGTHSYCRPCAARRMRERRPATREERAKYARSETLRRYGLTPDDFDELVRAQGGTCAICGVGSAGGQGVWHVDHDHACCSGRKKSCGKCIRGLLCSRCNIGLGNFKEDPNVLRQAIAYLETYGSRKNGLEQRG